MQILCNILSYHCIILWNVNANLNILNIHMNVKICIILLQPNWLKILVSFLVSSPWWFFGFIDGFKKFTYNFLLQLNMCVFHLKHEHMHVGAYIMYFQQVLVWFLQCAIISTKEGRACWIDIECHALGKNH